MDRSDDNYTKQTPTTAETDSKKEVDAKEQLNTSSNLSALTVFILSQVTSLLFLTTTAFSKDLQVNHGISVFEISFVRNAVNLFISIAMLLYFKEKPL